MAESKQSKKTAPKVEKETQKVEPELKFPSGPADPDARKAYGLD